MSIQQLRAQIAALQDATMDENRNFRSAYDEGKFDALSAVDALLDSVQKEPVSEEVDEAADNALNNVLNTHEIVNVRSCLEMFKFGANWQKAKDESTTEDLGEYINELSKQFPEVSFAKLSRIAVRVAKWQKEKDEEEKVLTYKHGFEDCKEQMMKDAFTFSTKHNVACILASECLRNHGWFSRERDFNDLFRHLSCVDELFEGKFSGKTKIIVIKED